MPKALRSHRIYVPLITLFGSAMLFFVYYLFYVSWQRKDADERAFRFLSDVGGQLAQRFASIKKVMAAAYVSEDPEGYLNIFLKSQVSNIRTPLDHRGGREYRSDGMLRIRLIDQSDSFSVRVEYTPATPGFSPGSSLCEQKIALCADLALDKERIRDITEQYFDNLLIVETTGRVLYQDGTAAMRIDDMRALFPEKPATDKKKSDGTKEPDSGDREVVGSFTMVSQFSNVVDVKLGGDRYKLYIQPVSVIAPIANANGETVKPVICGLWRDDRFQSEIVSIPYKNLLWSALLPAAAFAFLWPLLKLAYMSPSERLRRRQTFHLLFSALLVTGLLALIVLNYSYGLRNGETADRQLRAFADRMDSNVQKELVRALQLLGSVDSGEFLHDGLRQSEDDQKWIRTSVLQTTKEFDTYPYFEVLFWASADGKQQFKISTLPIRTPRTPITGADYFHDVLHRQHLSKTGDLPSEAPELKNVPFYRFTSIYSPTNGKYYVILAAPYTNPDGWTDLPANARDLPAQVLVTKFLSLQDAVVPDGFGYAVVDQFGEVHFHSSAARNRIENFFSECRQDNTVRSLVAQRSQGVITANYMGRQRRMLVRPMPYLGEPGLSLIVFRDCNYFSTVHVACIVAFLLLAVIMAIPVVVLLVVYMLRGREYPLGPLWPADSDVPRYVEIIVASACIALAFCMRFRAINIDESIVATLVLIGVAILLLFVNSDWTVWKEALPARLAVLAAIVCLAQWSAALVAGVLYVGISEPRMSDLLRKWGRRYIPLRNIYVVAAFSLLTLVVGLPSFALFRSSYDVVNRLAVQSSLLASVDRLEQRDEMIERQFHDLVEIGSSDRVRELLDARRGEDLDRYDNIIFDPRSSKPARSNSQPLNIGLLEPRIAGLISQFPVNQFGAAMRQLLSGEHTGPKWCTEENDGDQLISLVRTDRVLCGPKSSAEAAPGGNLLGVYPLWQLTGGATALLAILAALLLAWVQFVARKIFTTGVEPLTPLPVWESEHSPAGNVLIIGEPKSGKSAWAAAFPRAQVFDIVEMDTVDGWRARPVIEPTVIVDHFEFQINDPETNLAKLRLLEHLSYLEKRRVVVISAIDPMFCLVTGISENAESSKRLLSRWSNVLTQFEKRRIEETADDDWKDAIHNCGALHGDLSRIIGEECAHTAALRRIGAAMVRAHFAHGPRRRSESMRELMERADAHYRALWAMCTKTERLVLYQLAQDGWANPRNEQAIEQLEKRRLIRRDAGLRIMNSSFRCFVRSVQCPKEVAQWEQDEAHSIWGVVKLALGTAGLAFAGWLLYTERDVFQVGVGYIAALGAASGAIMTLVRNLTGKGAGQEANG